MPKRLPIGQPLFRDALLAEQGATDLAIVCAGAKRVADAQSLDPALDPAVPREQCRGEAPVAIEVQKAAQCQQRWSIARIPSSR